jgi:hypothetical protein
VKLRADAGVCALKGSEPVSREACAMVFLWLPSLLLSVVFSIVLTLIANVILNIAFVPALLIGGMLFFGLLGLFRLVFRV